MSLAPQAVPVMANGGEPPGRSAMLDECFADFDCQARVH
jgi:hypothetical protein